MNRDDFRWDGKDGYTAEDCRKRGMFGPRSEEERLKPGQPVGDYATGKRKRRFFFGLADRRKK